MPRRPTSEPEESFEDLVAELDRLERKWNLEKLRDRLPPDWKSEVLDAPARPRKQRLTLNVDEDVATFFRAWGPGYQARMNEVLRAFMRMKLAGVWEKWG